VLYTISIALYALLGGELGTVNYGLLPWLPVVFIVPVVFGPLAEEFGWRGFALPLLDHKNKVISSSIIIGFIWARWHAPLFWAGTGTAISGHTIDIATVAFFFLAVIGSSFIYTWLFNNTAGSMFIAVLLHLSMNASGTITGMLFPDMSSEQKLDLYEYYVVSLWAFLCLGALIRRFTRAGEINGAPQRISS
jgi:membrane protease YdiL (CAAX protease family)